MIEKDREEEKICEMFLNDLDCYPGGKNNTCSARSCFQERAEQCFFKHFVFLQKQN